MTTKLQQHQQAMKDGGLSPYFGYIWQGRRVTRAEYLALDGKQAERDGWN